MDDFQVRQVPGQTLVLDRFVKPTTAEIEGRWICSCTSVNPGPLRECLDCGADRPGGDVPQAQIDHDRKLCGGPIYCEYCRVEEARL